MSESITSEITISHFNIDSTSVRAMNQIRLALNKTAEIFIDNWGGNDRELAIKQIKIYTHQSTDWDISLKAEINGELVGFYLLSNRKFNQVANEEENVETTFNSNDYDSQLEGIALVVFEEHRGKGIGKLLIDAAEKLPFDFIWGMQFKSLNNLEWWQNKGRALIGQNANLNFTGKPTAYFLNQQKSLLTTPIPHLFQPDGLSCGPTCVKMVADYLNKEKNISIENISEFIKLDHLTGTTPDKLHLALQKMKVNFSEPTEENRNLSYLINKVIKNKKVAIVRTLTKGIKHWILVCGYNPETDMFVINDPWLGKINYTSEQLINVWSPRDYYFVEIEM